MGQVVKFFGWLLLGIGGTLAVFSHVTIGFVYGWDHLVAQVQNEPLGTALTVLAFVPGGVVYGLGVLLEKWSLRSDEKWAAQQAAAQAKAETKDQAES